MILVDFSNLTDEVEHPQMAMNAAEWVVKESWVDSGGLVEGKIESVESSEPEREMMTELRMSNKTVAGRVPPATGAQRRKKRLR